MLDAGESKKKFIFCNFCGNILQMSFLCLSSGMVCGSVVYVYVCKLESLCVYMCVLVWVWQFANFRIILPGMSFESGRVKHTHILTHIQTHSSGKALIGSFFGYSKTFQVSHFITVFLSPFFSDFFLFCFFFVTNALHSSKCDCESEWCWDFSRSSYTGEAKSNANNENNNDNKLNRSINKQ